LQGAASIERVDPELVKIAAEDALEGQQRRRQER
jgi:hypothetical protein